VATASSPSHEHHHIHPQSENKPWWWEMLCVYSHRDIIYPRAWTPNKDPISSKLISLNK
jgi:hypothetical protein